jgi:hypothetical protein
MAYVPPGVLPVRELQPSPLTPANVNSQVVPVLIGEARGFQTQSENFVLSGTSSVTLSKKGAIILDDSVPNLSFTVTNPVTYEPIGPGNFVVQQTAGTATGDETTTIRAIAYPSAPTATPATATGTVVPSGQYRYAVSYIHNIESGGGTTNYESGIGSATGTVTLADAVDTVSISNIGVVDSFASVNGTASLVGRNIYRSKNLGTNLNPSWGPYYKLPHTSGSVNLPTIDNGTATTYTDTTTDVTNLSKPVAGIENNDTLVIQYDYADISYWKPTLFSDFNDVVDKYGDAFDETGNIDSQLSFAAKMSILNGASSLVGIAVPPSPSQSDWEDALLLLEDDEDGQMIVPLTGDTVVLGLVQSHIAKMKQRNIFKTGMLGMDGSSGIVTKEQLRAQASALGGDSSTAGDICLISPATFSYFNSFLNVNTLIGGQYAAAALAGMHAGRTVAESLTRKQVAGLSAVTDERTTLDKNKDAASGLLVIEQIPSTGSIRIRHEITTVPGDINKRELPVALQRNNMVRQVVSAIDGSVIGQIFADSAAPGKVASIVDQILRGLVNLGQLTSYTGLAARISPSDPTVVEVRWQYKPVYTVHYVQITFGINLSGANATATGGGINLIL